MRSHNALAGVTFAFPTIPVYRRLLHSPGCSMPKHWKNWKDAFLSRETQQGSARKTGVLPVRQPTFFPARRKFVPRHFSSVDSFEIWVIVERNSVTAHFGLRQRPRICRICLPELDCRSSENTSVTRRNDFCATDRDTRNRTGDIRVLAQLVVILDTSRLIATRAIINRRFSNDVLSAIAERVVGVGFFLALIGTMCRQRIDGFSTARLPIDSFDFRQFRKFSSFMRAVIIYRSWDRATLAISRTAKKGPRDQGQSERFPVLTASHVSLSPSPGR